MKKIMFLFITTLSMSMFYGQEISDAILYSDDAIEGTARFRALSGAFGALGGDISAININPAGAAIFNYSYGSISVGVNSNKTNTNYFGELNNSGKDSRFDLKQVGTVFILNNNSVSPWKKIALSLAFDKTKNHRTKWFSNGTNTNSIDSYFFNQAQGLPLSDISAFEGESLNAAYADIGNQFGFRYQQAFLGYESLILDAGENDGDYVSNLGDGQFFQEYDNIERGYNGKIAFNFATQFKDNLYLGVNLNSHFINYSRNTFLFESNSNPNSIIREIGFENTINTIGSGFSMQLGAIAKITPELRVGLTYHSPTWLSIEEESTQQISTLDDSGALIEIIPNTVNVFPSYNLQTPSKITGSIAYVFDKIGLLSFDYETKDYSNTKFKPTSDALFSELNSEIGNTLKRASIYRVGGEYRYKNASFRGGYRIEESPYKDEKVLGDLTGYSFGVGYRFGNTNVDLTYDQFERESQPQLFTTGLVDRVGLNRRDNSITLTVGFNL